MISEAARGMVEGQNGMTIAEQIHQAEAAHQEFEAQLQLIARRERRACWDRAIASALVCADGLLGFFSVPWGLLAIVVGLWRVTRMQDQIRHHRSAAQAFAQLQVGAEQELARLRSSERDGAVV